MSPIRISILATLAISVAFGGHPAIGQCILANPSFELQGSGGAVFGGWNQFGDVGQSLEGTHGALAARVTGSDMGRWDLSAFWQRLDCEPGERWAASVRGWHSSVRQLQGESKAILNVEWRDASGVLIDYESHTIIDPSTPIDEAVLLEIESQPAPDGTVATHFLLGVLQGPTDPVPEACFDQARFESLGPPTASELQWDDFPSGRTLGFSDRSWRVKGPGVYDPGSSHFCTDTECSWVDAEGRLHLTIRQHDGQWHSTEVTLEESLGYGDYVFTTLGRLDLLHVNAVLGLFLWEYGPCYGPGLGWWNPYNEIDIEISRWGDPENEPGQFVVQPYDFPGNTSRFDADFVDGQSTSHAFRWLADRLEYRSWHGGPGDESPETLIHAWTYDGPHLPRPEQPRVHMNLWQFSGPPDSDQEVVIERFTFVPACPDGDCAPTPVAQMPPRTFAHLEAARPNPFNPRTTIGYELSRPTSVEIIVYDTQGRRVRTLESGVVDAGSHEVYWSGRDDTGRAVASGVYLYQLRAGNVVETRRMVLLK